MPVQPTESTATHSQPSYEVVIKPSKVWLRIDWRELWEYRDLLRILVRRDFLAKYKQTVLGPLWFILQPLLTALVLSIAFHKVAGVPTGRTPSFLFNLCALLPWSYFNQNVTTGSATFTANAHLFGKVYFPRLIVPVATVVSNLFALALQFAVFVGFYSWFAFRGADISIGPSAILTIPLILITAVFSLGLSLLISASTARYRDLSHVTPLLLQLWMFATPVFYRMDMLLNHPNWSWIAWANPMAPVVEGFRSTLLGDGIWNNQMIAVSAAISAMTLVLGIAAFNRTERTVVDTV